MLTASTGGGNVWKDLLKFNYRLGINYFNSVLIANKERFGKLPPEIRSKVRKIVETNMPLISKAMEDEEEALPKVRRGRHDRDKANDLADIEIGMKARSSAYWDEWAKRRGPDAVAALKQVRAALGR